jgi:DNA repair protein radc
MTKKLTIQEWALSERPREKFIEKGAESLSDAELLAILIRVGNKEENAIDLARKILNGTNNNISKLKTFKLADFRKFKGIGLSKAITIMAAFELTKRADLEGNPVKTKIYSSDAAAKAILPILQDLSHEECWVLYLNRGNKLLSKERITSGGVSSTVVDIKIIIKNAIEKLACAIILVHNHPSGNRKPGEQDKVQTERLKAAAKLCDIDLLDHLIIAGKEYFSFADEGLL